jgi:uncharacterized protein (TIRG00374 family)
MGQMKNITDTINHSVNFKQSRILDFNKIFQKILFIIPIGVLGNILFSFFSTEKEAFFALTSFSPQYLALAILLGIIPWFTNTLRVIIWTHFLEKRFSFLEMFNLVIGSELGSAISPTAIGGGWIKLGMLIQKGFTPGQAASLMTLGTFEEIIFFTIIVPIALIFTSIFKSAIFNNAIFQIKTRFTNIFLIFFSITIIIILIMRLGKFNKSNWPFSFLKKLSARIKNLGYDFLNVYKLIIKRGKSRFIITLILAAIQWICKFSVISALLAFFHIPFNIVQVFIFQCIVFTFMVLMPTPGGTIGAEATFYFVFGSLIPSGILGLTTAAWRFLTYYFQLSLASILFSIINVKTMSK